MDFDIDAVLDQLEKKLNQSDLEEKQAIETPPAVSSSTSPPSISPPQPLPTKSIDDLSLLDLDPLSHSDYQTNDRDQSTLDSFQQDLQDLYASSIVVDPPVAPPTLPDVSDQQEDHLSTSLPLAVEQLEIEVREEILQHTHEQPLPNGHHEETQVTTSFSTPTDEEQQSPLTTTTTTDANEIVENESDRIPHDTSPTQIQTVLHSVDSIVNAATMADLEDYIAPNPSGIDVEPLETSSELLFTPCEDNEENTIEIPSEEMKTDELLHLPLPSSSTLTTSTTQSQDFDLVKNILSEIFDKPEEELLDEDLVDEKETNIEQQELLPITPTNNNEDFRFLDEMLASIDVSDADIHQLTPAEIERVDNLLKDIVNSQQATEENQSPPSERPPSPVEPAEVPTAAAAAAAALPVDEELVRVEQEWAKLTDEQKRLGSIAPEWVSDDLAPACMKCANKFSITRRRHHCRACGKVFCSTCCSQKVKLIHDDSKEDRACNDCVKTINEVEYLWNYMRNNQKPRSSVLRKRTGASLSSTATGINSIGRLASEHKKSVTFDDGIKPGDQVPTSSVAAAAAMATNNIMSTHKTRTNENDPNQATLFKSETLTTEELEDRIRRLTDPNEPPVEFRVHNNLIVMSKIVDNFDCYLTQNTKRCWIFSTRGLCTVAQDELIFIFDDNLTNANELISDILNHIHQIYEDATRGSFVRHLGLSLSSKSSTFLTSSTTAGFLYFADSSVSYSLFPDAPYLFGILIDRLELPTAQCFPLRLLLRLGYEYQSYPWPLFSILNRDAIFSDTQQTIMSLLCDFRSFTYVLPTIRGLIISVGTQGSVSIRIPRNRHDDILKSLDQSSPHALSFGIMNVNRQIHSKHLVTIQNSADQQYETRIFSSVDCNNEQIMIGANFLVINASLRSRDSPSSSPMDTQTGGSFSSNNLNAKVNSIEDGIMLQIDGDALKVLKQCLRERKDYAILAKARAIVTDEQKDGNVVKRSSSEQLVEFIWSEEDNDVNRGVRSPIDHFPMDGIRNSRIHYAGQRSPLFRIRWTDLFFIECHLNNNESFDPTRLADSLAKAFTQALTPFIDMLVEAKYRKLGLRVTIDRENASYLAGSNGEQLSAFFLSQLDDHMIPIVMKASDNISRSAPTLVLELVFYLID